MKKIFCLLLSLFILLCSISACADTADTPKNTEPNNSSKNNIGDGRFLYTPSNGMLTKFDLQERTATLLCPDPLCDHGKTCLTSHIIGCCTTNEYIYIKRGDEPFNVDIYVYDIEKCEIEWLISGTQTNIISEANGYVYFTLGEYEFDEESQLTGEVFNVYRYNPKTKELKKVSKENVLGYANLSSYDDKTLIWQLGSKEYFSTDYNFENITELPDYKSTANVSNGYTYNYDAWTSETGIKVTMYRDNNETGERETLFENVASFRWANQITKDGFLYVPTEYQSRQTNGAEKEVLRATNKIVYVDAKDPTRTFEYELPDNFSEPYIFSPGGVVWYTGDYTSVELIKEEIDKNGNKSEIATQFFINTKTGESFFIDNEYTRRAVEE